MAPVEGIEPPPTVLETAVLPLYYTGIVWLRRKESNLHLELMRLANYRYSTAPLFYRLRFFQV